MPDTPTDYWVVTSKAGKMLARAYGKTYDDAVTHVGIVLTDEGKAQIKADGGYNIRRLRTSELAKAEDIRPGVVFDTPFERGCVVTSEVDPFSGSFGALDSEGVECSFHLPMVTDIRQGVI